MTELVLVRHGETAWNRALRFQGQIDVPLNDTGHAQAQRLVPVLGGQRWAGLICSDLLRTRQTAEPLAQALGPDLLHRSSPLWREQAFGLVDGLTVEEVKARHPQDWADWLRFDPDFAFPGAESTRQFHTRVVSALTDLLLQPCEAPWLVVTHGGVLDQLWRTAQGSGLGGPRRSLIPNAGINRLAARWGPAGLELQVQEWADVRHLDGLPPQPHYDQTRLVQAWTQEVETAHAVIFKNEIGQYSPPDGR